MSDTNDLPDTEAIRHEHPDVTGGWLRPAVFGAMDGLVSNFALIMGVVGGTASLSGDGRHAVVLAGLAGLAAGAFSMARSSRPARPSPRTRPDAASHP